MKTILAVDPSLSNLGYAIITHDEESNMITTVTTGMIHANQYAAHVINKEVFTRHTKRLVALNIIKKEIEKLIVKHEVDVIAIEDAFFNPRFPNALVALVQVTHTVVWVAFKKYDIQSYRVPTKIAKKCVTGTGGSGKTSVEEGIYKLDDLIMSDELLMTEHIADAVAVGYALIKKDYKVQK